MTKRNLHYKKKLHTGLAILLCLTGLTGLQGQNLISNPGFEDGMTGWSNWGGDKEISSEYVRTGTNALKHTGNGGFAQTVNDGIEVGKSYTFSAWFITPAGMDGDPSIGIQFKDVDGNTIETVGSDETISNTDNFKEYVFKFTVVEGTSYVRAFVYQEGGTASLYVDDFSLTMDPEDPDPIVPLNNPGFEDGMTGWSNWGGVNEASSEFVRNGTQALKHTGNGGFAQKVSEGFEIGKSYALSAWFITPDGMDGNASLGVQFKDADNKTIETVGIEEDINNTDNFQEYVFVFTIPEGTDYINVFVYQEGGTASLFADDFSLTLYVEEPDPVVGLTNPGFEDGMTGWSNWGGVNEVSSEFVRSGSNALKHTGNGGFALKVEEGFVVGADYTLSAWFITPDGMDGDASLGIQFKDADNNTIETIGIDEEINNTDNFQEYTFDFTVIEGTDHLYIFVYQEGGTASLYADDFSLVLDVEEPEPYLLGTGMYYTPSFVNVTGGGPMPDTTDGVIAICDGTGATDVTEELQMFLDSAAAENKPLLIPATDGFYKISERLFVNTSVMGIGGMPTIKQTGERIGTESNSKYQGLCLEADMTGWIYNLHLVGTYDGVSKEVQEDGEYAYNISLRGVNGVTIMNNILETPQGDHISNDGSPGKPIRNVLITNNNMINAWRCGISATQITDNWAVMNNYMSWHSQYVNPIDIEPNKEASMTTNFEVGYNKIDAPEPELTEGDHYYDCVFKVTGWFDETPGGNVFSHHNWGDWGVQWTKQAGYQGGESDWYNVEDLNNIEGETTPPSNASLPTVPTNLSYTTNSKTAFTLSWSASTAEAGLVGYLVYQDGYLLGTSEDAEYEVTGLECGSVYSMTVKAYDLDGLTSELSAGMVGTPLDCSGGINLLENPGFESELSTGWDQNPVNAVRDPEAARNGSYGLKIGAGGDGEVGQLVDLTPDSTYTLIIWAKMTGTDLESLTSYAGVKFKDSDGTTISTSVVDLTDTTDWKQYFLSFTVPSNTATTMVYAIIEADGTDHAVFTDDLALVAAVPVTGMTLSPETASINLGLVSQLSTTIEPANAINQQVTWSSSDTEIATVNSDGLVQALKEGTATITAISEDGDFTKTCDITVTPRTDNLIANPGFEEDLTVGWTSNWGGNFDVSTELFHSGSKSLYIGPGSAGRAQPVKGLVPGGTYTLSAWVLMKGDNIDSTNQTIAIQIKDALNQTLTIEGADISDSVDFSQVSVTFTLPLETAFTNVFAYLEGGSGANDTLYTDDWGLVSGWEPLPFNVSSDASASNIYVYPGNLSPAFSPEIENYTVLVPEGTTTVEVIASSTDAGATITGDGSIDVTSGSATVTIVITAEDGTTTNTYTVEITVDSDNGILGNETGNIKIYPNPISVGKNIHLDGVRNGEKVSIHDMSGRLMFEKELQGVDSETIQISNMFSTGTYIIKVTGKNIVYTKLMTVN